MTRTVSSMVSVIVYRYMRRHKLSSVRDWNRLCQEVAQRKASGGGLGSVVRALRINSKEHRPVKFCFLSDGKYIGALPKYGFIELTSRDRLKKYLINKKEREEELKRICEVCGDKAEKQGPLSVDRRWFGFGESLTLCVSCWNKLKPIRKRALEADNLRLEINRAKRKIYDSKRQKHDRENQRSAC